MQMYRHVPPTISPEMKKLYSVNSFTTAIQPPADDYVRIMTYLPNLQELAIYCDVRINGVKVVAKQTCKRVFKRTLLQVIHRSIVMMMKIMMIIKGPVLQRVAIDCRFQTTILII